LNVYVDSSVLLRVVLGEPGRLRIWPRITTAVSSELIRLECLRTIDRARLRLGIHDADVADRRAAVLEAIDGFTLVPLSPPVLERAAEPFPTVVGSLDAIHLASALLARDELDALTLATHDRELAVAARAEGFRVHGAPSGG
jgi:predicted nucleic acid-binding protein